MCLQIAYIFEDFVLTFFLQQNELKRALLTPNVRSFFIIS